MRRVVSGSIARWYLLMGAALMAVLLLTMSSGSHVRANGAPVGALGFVEVYKANLRAFYDTPAEPLAAHVTLFRSRHLQPEELVAETAQAVRADLRHHARHVA